MRKLVHGALVLFAVVPFAGCGNAAKDAQKAEVGKASTPAPAPASSTMPAETVALGPENAKIEFVGSKVTGKHDGGFRTFTGTVALSQAGPQASKVTLDIDMNSIWADNEKLTGHLKSPDFFDVANHPKATFVSTLVAPAPEGGSKYSITGDLSMHGVTKSITFPATIEISPSHVTANAEFSLNRKDFNVNYPGMADDLIRDDVLIKLAVASPRPGAQG